MRVDLYLMIRILFEILLTHVLTPIELLNILILFIIAAVDEWVAHIIGVFLEGLLTFSHFSLLLHIIQLFLSLLHFFFLYLVLLVHIHQGHVTHAEVFRHLRLLFGHTHHVCNLAVMLREPDSNASNAFQVPQKKAFVAAQFLPLQPSLLFFLFFLLLEVALIGEGLHNNCQK